MIDNHIEAKEIIDPQSGRRWAVSIQLPGRRSIGRPQWVNTYSEAEIEFYDPGQDPTKFGPLGQFVSSYLPRTLIDHLAATHGGLCLHGGVPAWNVSQQVVVEALKHCIDVLHAELDA